MELEIPMPPERLYTFGPAPAFNRLLTEHLLNEDDPLYNPEHVHLSAASIGFLWSGIPNSRRGRRVAGMAEMPDNLKSRLGKWTVGIVEFQLTKWFGEVPTFLVTIDADLWRDGDDAGRLALFEHEVYHCGQAVDGFGLPKFSRSTGLPQFRIRGHDIEEFTGVVRRYGIEATGQDRVDFVAAAIAEPEISRAAIANLCGTSAV